MRLVVAAERSADSAGGSICTVDVKAKRITVRPPEGLLELNGEWR